MPFHISGLHPDGTPFQASLLHDALVKCFPDMSIEITNQINEDAPGVLKIEEVSKLVSSKAYSEMEEKDEMIEDLEQTAAHAVASINSLQEQQQKLFDEFALLRQKYDDVKGALKETLWERTAKYHPDLQSIPHHDNNLLETESSIGAYDVGVTLGEGQFATVKVCSKKGDDKEFALKIIEKERINSYLAVRRVAQEIKALLFLRSNKYIVQLIDVFVSTDNLYIVTEIGGSDMFDFFDEHPEGVSEQWAKHILCRLTCAVKSCHDVKLCHRDLKPENILMVFDYDSEECTDLKLCDFGLCADLRKGKTLSDFCGSPGFFAPEMLTDESYDGMKSDIWSMGCVLLEMIFGHELFCDKWMAFYDYDVLKQKDKFKALIDKSLANIRDSLHFSEELNDFILKVLSKDPKSRPSATEMLNHPWLRSIASTFVDIPQEGMANLTVRTDLSVDLDSTESLSLSARSKSIDSDDNKAKVLVTSKSNLAVSSPLPKSQDFNNHMSERERARLTDEKRELSLPPIEPSTPSLGRARKILKQGQTIVKEASSSKAEKWVPFGKEAASIPEKG
jgi:serine/threonine protein kinase